MAVEVFDSGAELILLVVFFVLFWQDACSGQVFGCPFRNLDILRFGLQVPVEPEQLVDNVDKSDLCQPWLVILSLKHNIYYSC